MKTITPVGPTCMATVATLILLGSASVGFGNPQKNSATSTHEKPDALLLAAMKKMSIGVWSVNGTVTSKKTIKLHGLLSGEDFDLSMEPGVKPGVPMRGIVIKDKAWVCSDGETWHAGSADDRLIYNWAHVSIMLGRQLPPFENVGAEQRNGQTWLHVRLKVPEKKVNPKELPQYWLVLDSQGQAQYIGHTEMPMFSQAKNEVLYCSLDYAPATEKIAPPPLGPPVDEKAYGFNDIEQHKFDWKGKVVCIEVTPKILESKQIGEDTYRAFLKDTATPNHYGIVEFPHDALVKLGFLKKIVSGAHAWEDLEKMRALGRTEGEPVSFYVQVIPIGEKPAARAVAVGAKLVREPDGSVSYTWESPVPSRASPATDSSPETSGESAAAPAESPTPEAEESAADSIDRGIAKGNEKESPASAGTVEDFFNRAGAKKAAGDLDGAIADYDRAIQIDPKDAAIYNNRGLAKQARGDLDAAIVDFNRAIQLNPKDAVAYSNRGNTKRDKSDLDGAILDYNRAIRLDPRYAYAYYDRGLAKKQKSDLDGAIADYNRVIALDPKFAKAYCDRGVAKRRKGDLDGAISDYDRTVELDPKYAIAYFNRGNAKDDKGDLEGAIADYNHGIDLNPKDSKAYHYRADAHAKKKEYDSAVIDTLRAIELDPKNGEYYLSLGWYQLFNRKPREAIAASLKALELSPDDAVMIKTNLAHGYLFDNQFDKAKTIYLENKNAKLRDGKRTFSQAALDDFKEFQEAGITHPDMEKIKALLTPKTEAR